MQSIFLGYGKSEDPNSWVLFIGDDINTDASPTNPGRFYGGASYMALEVDNQGNYLVGSTRYQSVLLMVYYIFQKFQIKEFYYGNFS